MNYIELSCKITPFDTTTSEILVAELSVLGFESFIEESNFLKAYIPYTAFNENEIKILSERLTSQSKIEFHHKQMEEKNWNESWEKNYFEPIIIENQCVVRSSFHKLFPEIKYQITIDPKMAFGTGHHETTSLMIKEILQLNLKEKKILDMGCGTGILAILSSMKGATEIYAIDIDEWSYKNTLENIKLNDTNTIQVERGDVNNIKGKKYDLIYANINKNVLLADIQEYSKCLEENGILMLSGFYTSDFDSINSVASENGFQHKKQDEKNNWMMLKYLKIET